MHVGRVILVFVGKAGVVFVFGKEQFEIRVFGGGLLVGEHRLHAVTGRGSLRARGGKPFHLLLRLLLLGGPAVGSWSFDIAIV